jgi:hypothetical protein
MRVEAGKAYWTIHPSSESSKYGAEVGDVCRPYRSICRHVEENAGTQGVELRCYFSADDDHGESDSDPNASFYIYSQEVLDASVFDSELDALNALYKCKQASSSQSLADLDSLRKECRRMRDAGLELLRSVQYIGVSELFSKLELGDVTRAEAYELLADGPAVFGGPHVKVCLVAPEYIARVCNLDLGKILAFVSGSHHYVDLMS